MIQNALTNCSMFLAASFDGTTFASINEVLSPDSNCLILYNNSPSNFKLSFNILTKHQLPKLYSVSMAQIFIKDSVSQEHFRDGTMGESGGRSNS